jgi:hypothetical protein
MADYADANPPYGADVLNTLNQKGAPFGAPLAFAAAIVRAEPARSDHAE